MEAIGVPVFDTTKYSFLRKSLLYTLILCNFWMTTQFIVLNILQINNFYGFTFSLSYLCIMILVSAGMIANLHILRKTKQLLKLIDENIYTYADDLEIFPAEEQFLYDEHMTRIFAYMLSAFFLSTTINILSPLFQFLLMSQMASVIVYPGWIPWSTDGVTAFICTYLLQTGAVLLGSLQFNFLICFPIFVVFEFRQQCRRLNIALKTIEGRSRNRCSDRMKVNYFKGGISEMQHSAEYKSNIISCIRHYQMIIR